MLGICHVYDIHVSCIYDTLLKLYIDFDMYSIDFIYIYIYINTIILQLQVSI